MLESLCPFVRLSVSLTLCVQIMSRQYLLNAKPFGTKLSIVVHHPLEEVSCERLMWELSGQGYSEDSYSQYDCVYHLFVAADLFSTKFNLMVHHHKLQCPV